MSPEAQKLISALPARIWQRIDLDADGCWKWRGRLDRDGYGETSITGPAGSKNVRAHRVVFAAVIGPIPADHDIDHICWVRDCVNPAHLRALPALENRGLQRRFLVSRNQKRIRSRFRNVVCHAGHSMCGPNLYIRPSGQAVCRACRARYRRDYQVRIRAEKRNS